MKWSVSPNNRYSFNMTNFSIFVAFSRSLKQILYRIQRRENGKSGDECEF